MLSHQGLPWLYTIPNRREGMFMSLLLKMTRSHRQTDSPDGSCSRLAWKGQTQLIAWQRSKFQDLAMNVINTSVIQYVYLCLFKKYQSDHAAACKRYSYIYIYILNSFVIDNTSRLYSLLESQIVSAGGSSARCIANWQVRGEQGWAAKPRRRCLWPTKLLQTRPVTLTCARKQQHF